MLTIVNENIFNMQVDAIINPVNCIGIMGGGLALAFKEKYPDMFDAYHSYCKDKKLSIGCLHLYQSNDTMIINFPTKNHWKDDSKIEYIESGLKTLISVLKSYNIKSVAIPKLGCGLGNLDWNIVKPLIISNLNELVDINIYILE